MSSTNVNEGTSSATPEARVMDMKLEVVTLPVADVDEAKRFYQNLGWRLDADIVRGDAFRAVQLTPPHSSCSIAFGKGLTSAEPGSVKRLLLIVSDIDPAREDLVRRGVEVTEAFHLDGGACQAQTRKAAPIRLTPPSATRTATSGSYKRSIRGSQGASRMRDYSGGCGPGAWRDDRELQESPEQSGKCSQRHHLRVPRGRGGTFTAGPAPAL